MMKNQSLVVGAGALGLGLILGIAVSGSRVDDKIGQAMNRMDALTAQASAAQEEAMSALDARFGALEAQVAEAADAAASLSEGVGAQMTEMQQGLVEQIEAVTTGAEDRLAALRDELTAVAPAQDDAAATESSAAPAADMAAAATRSVGETAILADGAVRVFVSRLDADAGTARLSINGSDTTLAIGEAATVSLESGDCSVSATSIGAEGVALASDCGAAPVGADVPPAPAEGFRPGEVAVLAEGDLRVFVSGLAVDNSAARLAINGLELETVSSGTSVALARGDRSCTVTVTGVGNGLVGLDGTCE